MKTFRIIKLTLCFVLAAALLTACHGKKTAAPVQLEPTAEERTAVINFADYGSISLRLFEKAAPEAVAQFIRLAQSGKYNGSTVKNVIEDYCVMVLASEPDAEASDKAFKDETDAGYYPFRGALCLTEAAGISAQQFMIVTADTAFLNELEELLVYKKITPEEYFKTAYGADIDEELYKLFLTNGGAPWLYGHSIVFGQVYEGFEVLDAISSAEVEEGSSYSPTEDIIIESIEIK